MDKKYKWLWVIGQGGASYSPDDFPDLKFWIEGRFLTASEIVAGVLTDGAEIDHVDDLSGNGATVTPSSTFKRPTYETNEINSLPIMRFGGSDNLRGVKAKFNFLHQGDHTLYILIRPTNITTTQVLFDSTNDGSTASIGFRVLLSTNGKITVQCFANTAGQTVYNSVSANGAITINQPNLIVSRYTEGAAGNDHELFINGLLVASSQGTLTPSGLDSFALPHWFSNIAGLGGLLNGDVALVFAYSVAQSDLVVQKISGGIAY